MELCIKLWMVKTAVHNTDCENYEKEMLQSSDWMLQWSRMPMAHVECWQNRSMFLMLNEAKFN